MHSGTCVPDEELPFLVNCKNNVFAKPSVGLTFAETYLYRPTSIALSYQGYKTATPKSLLCGVWGSCDPFCDSFIDGDVIVDKCILIVLFR